MLSRGQRVDRTDSGSRADDASPVNTLH